MKNTGDIILVTFDLLEYQSFPEASSMVQSQFVPRLRKGKGYPKPHVPEQFVETFICENKI